MFETAFGGKNQRLRGENIKQGSHVQGQFIEYPFQKHSVAFTTASQESSGKAFEENKTIGLHSSSDTLDDMPALLAQPEGRETVQCSKGGFIRNPVKGRFPALRFTACFNRRDVFLPIPQFLGDFAAVLIQMAQTRHFQRCSIRLKP